MITTNNGTIDAVAYTSMVNAYGEQKPALVCKVPLDTDDEMLVELFKTSMVEDTVNNRKYHNTKLLKITKDDQYRYVWMTYTMADPLDSVYLEALSILGVQTDENEVTENVQA